MIAFYTAEQKAEESIAEWGLRLEEIIQMTSTNLQLSREEKNDMLKEKFWRSLYNREIKNATRNSFESTDSFEIIRRKARAEEQEIKHIRKETPDNEIFKTLLDKMETLEKRMIPKDDTNRKYDKGGENTLTEILKRIEQLEQKVDRYNQPKVQTHHQNQYNRNSYHYRRNEKYQDNKPQTKQHDRNKTETNKAEEKTSSDKADRKVKPGNLNP